MTNLTRRRLLLGAAGAIPAASAATAAVQNVPGIGIVQQVLLSAAIPRQAQGAAFFTGQSALASNFDPNGILKRTTLKNMGGDSFSGYTQQTSVAASIVAFINPSGFPRSIQRLFTASNNNNFEHLTVDLLPDGTQLSFFDSLTGTFHGTAYNVPSLRIKAAVIVGGALRLNSFIAEIPRWYPGTWQLFMIFLNGLTSGGAASVEIWQYLKGYRDSANEKLFPSIGYPNNDQPTVSLNAASPPKLAIPFGMTGNPNMLNFTIGGVPGSGAGLSNLLPSAVDQFIFSPIVGNPAWTTFNLVSGSSFINPPGLGAPGLFSISIKSANPIRLGGGVLLDAIPDTGFPYNGGPAFENVNGDTLFIDPTFNPPPGHADILPVSGDLGRASNLGTPFDE
jgi:hypothetical protein